MALGLWEVLCTCQGCYDRFNALQKFSKAMTAFTEGQSLIR